MGQNLEINVGRLDVNSLERQINTLFSRHSSGLSVICVDDENPDAPVIMTTGINEYVHDEDGRPESDYFDIHVRYQNGDTFLSMKDTPSGREFMDIMKKGLSHEKRTVSPSPM